MLIAHRVERIINITDFYTAFEIRYKPGYHFDGEDHNFWEFVYVIDGSVGVSADENVYELGEHHLIFHKPMEFHKLWVPDRSHSHLFICSFRAEGDAVNRLADSVFSLKSDQRDQIGRLIDVLREGDPRHPFNPILRFSKKRPGLTQTMANHLELLLLMLLGNSHKVNPIREDKNAMLYNKIIRTMEEHVYEQLTVPELAKECSISVSALNKLFAAYTGCGVHKYFIKLKIKKAITLLHEGLPVGQISETLGFNNQNYFSMVFKRETGLSPRHFMEREM